MPTHTIVTQCTTNSGSEKVRLSALESQVAALFANFNLLTPKARELQLIGGSGVVISPIAAQNLSADRQWTISLDPALTFLTSVVVDGVTITGDGTLGNPLVAIGGGGTGLPSQVGQGGKFLTTDGTNASWATIVTTESDPVFTAWLATNPLGGFLTTVAVDGVTITGDGTIGNPLTGAAAGVTSVGLSMPTGFSVANSPITTAGILSVTTTLDGLILGNGSGFEVASIGTGLSLVGGVLSAIPDDNVLQTILATTAVLPNSPTYNNGVAGVGATLTATVNGAMPNIDGVVVNVGDRILIKNQVDQTQNGVYEVTDKGSAGTPYILTRTTDSDETADLEGQVIAIGFGSSNKGRLFTQTTDTPIVGTNPIVYSNTTSKYVTQQNSGTQTQYNIPYWTASNRQLSKGTTVFNYNPTTTKLTVPEVLVSGLAGTGTRMVVADASGNLSDQAIPSLVESDPVFTAWLATPPNVSIFTNDSGYLTGITGLQVTTALGYTPENVADKDTDVTLAANSDTKYPSQKAIKTYVDAGDAALQAQIAPASTSSKLFNYYNFI